LSSRPRLVATATATLSPVVKYHGLARRYLMPPRFLMRRLLNGGTLGGQRAMTNLTQLDYLADDFPERAREFLSDGVAFQFCLTGSHFAAVSRFLSNGDLDVGRLVLQPHLRGLAVVVTLARGLGRQTTLTPLVDRLQVDIGPAAASTTPALGRDVLSLLPADHLLKMRDLSDQIHLACDFLLLESQHELLRINHVNDSLHRPDRGDPWPDFLLAFASNGCGDYYAYDLRTTPSIIRYMDPDQTVEENLRLSRDRLRLDSFADWCSSVLARQSHL
jgi:hypothetical protein